MNEIAYVDRPIFNLLCYENQKFCFILMEYFLSISCKHCQTTLEIIFQNIHYMYSMTNALLGIYHTYRVFSYFQEVTTELSFLSQTKKGQNGTGRCCLQRSFQAVLDIRRSYSWRGHRL